MPNVSRSRLVVIMTMAAEARKVDGKKNRYDSLAPTTSGIKAGAVLPIKAVRRVASDLT